MGLEGKIIEKRDQWGSIVRYEVLHDDGEKLTIRPLTVDGYTAIGLDQKIDRPPVEKDEP